MYKKLLLSLFFIILLVQVSVAQQWTWSSWVPVLDRNENKIQVSITFVEQEGISLGYVDEKQRVPTFHYKFRNKYKEAISGRIVFDYQSMNGDDLTMSCVLYNLQPDQEYTNHNQSLRFVKSVSNFRFVEFESANKTSSLISYTASDSVIFRMYSEIKQQEANKSSIVQSGEKGKITVKDNSHNKIYYKGPNENQISSLLSKVKGWTTNSGLNVKNGVPPKLDINSECQRDQYVYSALLYSWAAESYFRINETQKANEASAKVSDLLNITTQLCSNGGIHLQNGSCKTEAIFPCSDVNIGSNTHQASSLTTVSSSSLTQSNLQPASGNNKADFKNEKELFSGLLPVLAALNTNDYNQQATSISGFMDNLVSYSEKSGSSDPITNIFLKLAALDLKLQTAEQTGNNNSFLNSVSSLTGNTNSKMTIQPSSLYSGYGMQNNLQQESQMINIVTQFANSPAFENWINPDHPTNHQIIRQGKLNDVILNRNEDYREKYGYTVKDFTDAIRNFDDALLDKILSTGFPVDTKVIHDNPYTEVQLGDYYGTDYYLNGLHYACIYGNEYAVKRFLEKKLDINEVAKAFKGFNKYSHSIVYYGRPIEFAIRFHQAKIIKLLLANGVETSNAAYTVWGARYKSAYELAKYSNFLDIARLLEKYPR